LNEDRSDIGSRSVGRGYGPQKDRENGEQVQGALEA